MLFYILKEEIMKALIFDVDDTLYDLSEPFKKAYIELYGEADKTLLENLYKDSRKYSDMIFDKSQAGEVSDEEMYIFRIQNAFRENNMEISREDSLIFQETYRKHQKDISLSPTIKKMLTTLKSKWTLGLISNGFLEHQLRKIETLGLDKFIPKENIFVSGAYGISKPDKALYEIATQNLGIAPEDCYFIGDSFENDIVGSKNAGLEPIWFNRRNYNEDIKDICNSIVTSEEELAELLLNL